VVWACREKTDRLCSEESRPDGEKTNNSRQRKTKKTIREVIKKDLEINGLNRSMVLDRTLWRKLIHVADPT